MVTRNQAVSTKIMWGWLTLVLIITTIGSLLYKPFGPMALIGGMDFGFVTGLLLVSLLIINLILGVLMEYTRVRVNLDLHILTGASLLAFGVIHALYNYNILY